VSAAWRERLGLAGHDFVEGPEELLATFKDRLGIDKLDFWLGNRGSLEPAAYRELLDARGIEVFTVNADSSNGRFGSSSNEEAAATSVRNAIAEAGVYGCDLVQFYLAPPSAEDAHDPVGSLARSLAPVAAEALEAGVRLVVENNFDHRDEDGSRVNVARTPGAIRELIETVGPDRLAVTVDPTNFVMTNVDPVAALRELRPYLVNFHFKDCVPLDSVDDAVAAGEDRLVLRDGRSGFARSVPVGQGALPWTELLAELDAGEGFDGWLTLDPYCDPEDVVAWTEGSVAGIDGLFATNTGGGS
jgi:sugar phosphate isomerase/epimerase